MTSVTCEAETENPSGAPEFVHIIIPVLVEFVLFMLSNYMSLRFSAVFDVRYDFSIKIMFNLS